MLLRTVAQAKQETPIWFEEMVRHVMQCSNAVQQISSSEVLKSFDWGIQVQDVTRERKQQKKEENRCETA